MSDHGERVWFDTLYPQVIVEENTVTSTLDKPKKTPRYDADPAKKRRRKLAQASKRRNRP